MIDTRFSLEKVSISDVTDAIRSFAKRRTYIIKEDYDEIEYTFTIYDRKPDSPIFNNIMQMFAGSYMLNDRIRLLVKIRPHRENLEVYIKGEALLSDLDLVNDRSKRSDAVRLEIALKELTRQLSNPSIQRL